MAILIVDDEQNTREALRNLLAGMGHKVVLEAKNGEEGLRVIDAEKSRIRMIIADWEMPYMDGLTLLRHVSTRPFVDLAPFLLITSDLPKSSIESFRRENSRLDSYLIKPFRMKALERALAEAHRVRCAARCEIAYIGEKYADSLRSVIAAGDVGHWKAVVKVESAEALTKQRGVGAVFVEPESCAILGGDWLGSFKKTPLGGATPVICLSRDPGAIRPWRTQCQFFLEPTQTSWKTLLQRISATLEATWELELLMPLAKAALQKKDVKGAKAAVEELLKLNAMHSDVLTTEGDLFELIGDSARSTQCYREAIAINPCLPRPYLKLSELVAISEMRPVAESAARFCPGNIDVLMMSAVVWEKLGDKTSAGDMVKQILELNPAHAVAKEMLERL